MMGWLSVEFWEDVGTLSPFAVSVEVIVLFCLGVSSRIFFADIKLRGGGRSPSFAMSFRFTLLCGTDIQILLNPDPFSLKGSRRSAAFSRGQVW